jgi:hypothetical protein
MPRSAFGRSSCVVLLAAVPALTTFGARAQDPVPAAAGTTIVIPASCGYAHPDPEAMKRQRDGSVERCDGELVFYLDVATLGWLEMRLERTANAPATKVRAVLEANPMVVRGARTEMEVAADQVSCDLGKISIMMPGMYRLVLSTCDGTPLTNLAKVVLGGEAIAGLHTNTAERRNAASVHLNYPVPKEQRDDVEWFYVELTPKTDPVWTYYMATGWQRGYFGMQVNSASERRVIFSVWDAGKEAKDRSKVGEGDRVALVAKGEGVVASDFGNEGTGGHSHLVYPWQLGGTFRFLLHARVDGDATIYSGWFWFAETKRWGLIASFRAPKDGVLMHGLYSFSENFGGANGDVARECEYGNVWVRTRGGEWLPLRTARFTYDETGKAVRRDRYAGVRGDRFYLAHGGFGPRPTGAVMSANAAIEVHGSGEHPADAELPVTAGDPRGSAR